MANILINLDSLNPQKFKKTVRHKVKDGINTFRFLPPFGEAAEGFPYCKWNVVWGLTDPSSGRERPFASPSTYEGSCPVFDYLDILRPRVEQDRLVLASKGASEAELKVKFEKINNFISQIRPKTVYSYNATDKTGTVGVLELKATAHKDVLKVMNQYIKDYNQDPTSLKSEPSDSGVWINVLREGRGFETKYSASKNQIMVKDASGVPSYQDDRSSLAENIFANYSELGYDLYSIYQKTTYSDLKDILVANLLHIAEEGMPEVLVEGFGLEEFGGSEGTQTHAPTQPVQSATATVSNAALTPTSTNNASDEELLAMADDLFNS